MSKTIDFPTRIQNLETAVFSGPNVQGRAATFISADGHIETGPAFITKMTAGALTLPAPSLDDDGRRLLIMSLTAAAHVITAPTDAINTDKSVATFGGAVGSYIEFIAARGIWMSLGSRG